MYSHINQLPKRMVQHTKRLLLRKTATLFDPLGFLSLFIIHIKIILQELWVTVFDWDDDFWETILLKS